MIQIAQQRICLPDGSQARALKAGASNNLYQEEMFSLRKDRVLLPSETIMGVKELAVLIQDSGGLPSIREITAWRTPRFVVYRCGFEKNNLRIGSEIDHYDYGSPCRHTFLIPDVRHPADRNKSLGDAEGMLEFDIGKLAYDKKSRVISVTSDFNPETDVCVIDRTQLRTISLADSLNPDYYKSAPGEMFHILCEVYNPQSTGYFGSLTLYSGPFREWWYYISANLPWNLTCGVMAKSESTNRDK